MIMKLLSGLKHFMSPVTVRVMQIDNTVEHRPQRTPIDYIVQGSIAIIDGTEEYFRPGGKVNIGDVYLQVQAGKIPAEREDPSNPGTILKEDIELKNGDRILLENVVYEIYYNRNEPSVCDVSDYYASQQEVSKND